MSFRPSNRQPLNRLATLLPLLLCSLVLTVTGVTMTASANTGAGAAVMSQSTPVTSDAPAAILAADEHPSFTVFETPEPSRAILLVIGSLLVLSCYRRAWVNFRRP